MHSLHHLELINALAKHRHFGRAADQLGISQPALSKGLNHLESVLGVKLFDRAAPIAPTVFGEIVLQRSASLANGFEEMLREIELAKGLYLGTLAVATGIYPAEISVHEAIADVSRQHPWLQCNLVVKDWIGVTDEVMSARCDVGIADITVASGNPELMTEAIRRVVFPMFCRAAHPLATKSRVTLEDVLGYPWVGPSLPESMRSFLPNKQMPFGYSDPATGRTALRIRVETFSAIRRIVLGGDALSAAAPAMIKDDLEQRRLVILPIELPWLAISYGFIWRRGRSLSPAALSFMKCVRSVEERLDA
jgi:DNA-binding transcriptional LysR family regulator